MVWPIEEIPDEDRVFLRVNKKNSYPCDYVVSTSVFSQKGEDGLSTDWEKYASPLECRNRATSIPEDNGVISLLAKDIRKIERLDVKHAPISGNRAHSLILGIPIKGAEKTRLRNLLTLIAYIEIPVVAQSRMLACSRL